MEPRMNNTVAFTTTALKTLSLVFIFYLFSISLTFYNKKYITIYPYPLSITVLHLVVKFTIALILRSVLETITKTNRVELKWTEYVKRIGPIGLASSLDIGLSNWSFEFITVSLYTMTKSTSIIFIMFFAILLKLEKKRCSLVFVVLFIAGGLIMFTYKSTQFNLDGFLLVLTASFVCGIRWSTAQLVTQRAEIGLGNPIDMIYHIQPFMILSLLPLSVTFEGMEIASTSQLFRFTKFNELFVNLSILFSGAVLAFCLEFSEYLLVTHTSSLTLSIAGVFKEICTLYLAARFNHDQMNTVNMIGLAVCLMGIIIHVIIKAMHHNPTFLSWSRQASIDNNYIFQRSRQKSR